VTRVPFELKSSRKIEKQVQKLDSDARHQVLILLLELKTHPVPAQQYDVTKISGMLNRYRVRIGDIRVIYDVMWNQKTIEVFRIEKRKDRTYKF
jgi:mRNA interferase RelE/StbE